MLSSKKYLLLLILFELIFILYSCSTKYLHPDFVKFNEATDLIGKNVLYAFEKLQEEEMNLRIIEAIDKEAIKPSELEPKVLTFEHIEIRKELIKYLTNYTNLLVSMFEEDEKDDILENTENVNLNLVKINQNHKNFLTDNEIGVFSAISSAIPEALTYTKKRNIILKIMNENQEILEKIVNKLKNEIEISRVMINNFYDRQFRIAVVEKWPKKYSSREKYAKKGSKIIINRNKINIILVDIIKAIDIIPKLHKNLRKSFKSNETPVRAMKDLIDYAYRTKELYREFSED